MHHTNTLFVAYGTKADLPIIGKMKVYLRNRAGHKEKTTLYVTEDQDESLWGRRTPRCYASSTSRGRTPPGPGKRNPDPAWPGQQHEEQPRQEQPGGKRRSTVRIIHPAPSVDLDHHKPAAPEDRGSPESHEEGEDGQIDHMDYMALQDIAGWFGESPAEEDLYSKSLPDLTSNSGDSTTSTEERKEETQDEGYSNQKEDTSDPRVSGQTSKDRPGKEDQSTSSEDEERGGTARDRGHHLNR